MKKKRKLLMTTIVTLLMTVPVYASEVPAEVNELLKPFNIIKALFLAAIGMYGVIVVAKNAVEIYQAFQQKDNSGAVSAFWGMLGGLIMAGISTVMAILGF